MEQAIMEKQQESGEDQEKKNLFSHHDIIEAGNNLGRGLNITKKYDPKHFWETLGLDYYKGFKKREQFTIHTPWLIERMQTLGNFETSLEVGCGFARILPCLLEAGVVRQADGVDISPKIIESSKIFLSPTEVKEGEPKPPDFRDRIRVIEGDVRRLPDFASESYDVVYSSETLQHISPEEVDEAILEMVRISKKYIILIERWAYPGEHAEPHIWSHNYSDKFRDLGLELLQNFPIANGIQGVIVRKRG